MQPTKKVKSRRVGGTNCAVIECRNTTFKMQTVYIDNNNEYPALVGLCRKHSKIADA